MNQQITLTKLCAKMFKATFDLVSGRLLFERIADFLRFVLDVHQSGVTNNKMSIKIEENENAEEISKVDEDAKVQEVDSIPQKFDESSIAEDARANTVFFSIFRKEN